MQHARSIAAAQTVPVRGDVDANLEQHARLVHAATEAQPQVVVFPELSLTGYELDVAEELAFGQSDPRLQPLVELASVCEMTLIVGAPVRLGSRLHIGAFIIAPDSTVDLYTKRHLGAFPASASPGGVVPPAEHSVFHPGSRQPLIRLAGYTAAIAVCSDVGRPSHPAQAKGRGADAYLASMFVIPADLDEETARLRTHAERHAMAVAFANYGGPSGGLAAGGCSAIWSDDGELLAQLERGGTGVLVASENHAGWHVETVRLPDT